MFERIHHQKVAVLLSAFDSTVLSKSKCYFGGDTAIVLALGEYRESVDIDFLCSSRDGFRILRNTVNSQSLGALLKSDIKHLREVRCERDKISTFLGVDGVRIKVEFILEGNIDVAGEFNTALGVPTLARNDMYATMLLANTDRGLDKATLSRDIIDLAMMIQRWGSIPPGSWEKAKGAYGAVVFPAFERSCELIEDKSYLIGCLQKMQIDTQLSEIIRRVLRDELDFCKSQSDNSPSCSPS